MDNLTAQRFHQRIILAFRVCNDNIVRCGKEYVRDFTLCTERLTASRCAEDQTVGVFVKRNFLGAGKSYMIKGKQAEKKAENALCGRLKCVLMAGNIKPLPTSEKRLRQG